MPGTMLSIDIVAQSQTAGKWQTWELNQAKANVWLLR